MGSLGTLHLHTGDSQVGFTVAQSQVGCLGALGTMGASLAPGLWLEDSLLLKGKPHLRLPWRHRYWFLCGAEPTLWLHAIGGKNPWPILLLALAPLGAGYAGVRTPLLTLSSHRAWPLVTGVPHRESPHGHHIAPGSQTPWYMSPCSPKFLRKRLFLWAPSPILALPPGASPQFPSSRLAGALCCGVEVLDLR